MDIQFYCCLDLVMKKCVDVYDAISVTYCKHMHMYCP